MAEATGRTVVYRPLDGLVDAADPRNPKTHDVPTIVASLSRFGMVDPVVVDGRTGLVVAGHGRVNALVSIRDGGGTPPDGVTVDGDGGWQVPTVDGWESADDLAAAGALIALNRTTELGGWADDALLDLLDELAAEGVPSLDGTGFDTHAIEDLQRYALSWRLATGQQPDDLPSPDSDPVYPAPDLVGVLVVVDPADRARLYQVLADLDWVVDVRNSVAKIGAI